METNTSIKVFIVDDHQMMIDGVKALLKNHPSIRMVGESLTGKKALEILEQNEIDVAIVDINLPDISGIELTKIIKQKYPNIHVLILSMHNERSIIHELLEAKISGYILKNVGKDELVEAIETVSNGQHYFSRLVSNTIMGGLAEQPIMNDIPALTKRELEIIRLIVKEYSTEQIATTLFISKHTVDSHRKSILHKTGAKNSVALTKYAIANHLV